MVLEASNSIGKQTFREYSDLLGSRVGVAMNSQFLMYVISGASGSLPDLPVAAVGEDELLLVLEKASAMTLVKDKLIKVEEAS